MIRAILVGPGRAGMSLATAMDRAGHSIVGVLARRQDRARQAAAALDGAMLSWESPLPAAELLIVSVSDGAITDVALRLAEVTGAVTNAVHLSGLTPVAALSPLAEAGVRTGSFHPLQTLPSSEVGAARISGAWVGITADSEDLRSLLFGLAESLEAHPFDLDDGAKPLYHAAATAASNLPVAPLALAEDLFSAAGVPFEAARPLVAAVAANVFEMGSRAALTGPIARGDKETVAAQIAAVDEAAPQWSDLFRRLSAALATLSGREDDFPEIIP